MSSEIEGQQKIDITLQAMQRTREEEAQELQDEILTSKLAFENAQTEAVNPFAQLQRSQKSLDTNKARLHKILKTPEKSRVLAPIEDIKQSAERFHRRNQELDPDTLVQFIREFLKEGDTQDEILEKLLKFYPDVSLADEVLEFLAENTRGDLSKEVQAARQQLLERYGREIAAGRNITANAREAATQGLGSPTNLRDLYRNITGNPRDSNTLFQELSQKYAFKDLKKVVDFLLHSLGSDMKSKGPSIPRGQLHRLLTETRSLQAILGVYRFFSNRMGLIANQFSKEGLDMPSQLTFENLAKQFMALAGERYPSADRVLQLPTKLGIEKWIIAKIIALSQLRDAVREVAMNQIYRSVQHRDELYLAILEALEELEDELEELLDQEREKEEESEADQEEEESSF